MPVSYIDIPSGVSPGAKEKMAREVFDAIHKAWPIPDTRILIREWPAESVSQDGVMEDAPMRPICFLDVPPGLPVEAKGTLVQRISVAIAEASGRELEEIPLPSGSVVRTKRLPGVPARSGSTRQFPRNGESDGARVVIRRPVAISSRATGSASFPVDTSGSCVQQRLTNVLRLRKPPCECTVPHGAAPRRVRVRARVHVIFAWRRASVQPSQPMHH